MDAYTDIQLIARAGKLASMSNEEIFAFNAEARMALASRPMEEDLRNLLLEAYVQSTEKVYQIKATQKETVQKLADEQKELEKQKADPRKILEDDRNECTTQLKNKNITQEQREELEKRLDVATSALQSWGKIDAEQKRVADNAQRISDDRAAVEKFYIEGTL